MRKICTVEDCDGKFLAKGYCQKHYYRFKRGQSITGKSRFDRRPATVKDGLAYLELANGKGSTVINLSDKKLEKHNWSLSGDGYPMTYINGKFHKLHHMVVGKPPVGLVTDHIDRDKLNNCRDNLRFITQKENVLNSDCSLIKQWKSIKQGV